MSDTRLRFAPAAAGALILLAISVGQANEVTPPTEPPAGVAAVFKNSLGLEFVRVEPGEFWMGSRSDEANRDSIERRHRVTITKPFYLGIHELRRGVFAEFVRETGYRTDAEKEGSASTAHGAGAREVKNLSWRKPGFDQNDQHPVVCVSWGDAVNFCDWMSHKEKRRYRLPTEAEWSYACRANQQTEYVWGDDPNDGAGWANFADLTLKAKVPKLASFLNQSDGYAYTAPIASFKPNAWGLFDMAGNACEWCHDRYADFGDEPATDPTGPEEGRQRVICGGSWDIPPRSGRIANRAWSLPYSRFNFVGFRVLLEIDPATDDGNAPDSTK